MLNPIQTTLNVLPLPLLSVSVGVSSTEVRSVETGKSLLLARAPTDSSTEVRSVETGRSLLLTRAPTDGSTEALLFPESAVPWLIDVHDLLTELVHRDTDLRRIRVRENEYKKLLTLLEDLMWSVGDDADAPLIYLFTCIGNFTLRYEDAHLPKWEALGPELAAEDSDDAEIVPCEARESPPGWTDEEVAIKAFFSLGECLWEAGEAEKAVSAFTTAIRLKPDSAAAYCNRGSVYYAIGSYAAAIRDYAEAIRLEPARVEGYFNRAVTHFLMQDYEAAIQDYSEALARKPTYADAYVGRAHAKFAMHRYEAAVRDYDEAARLTPNNDEVRRYRHLAQVRDKRGQASALR